MAPNAAEEFFGFCLQVFCQAGPPQWVQSIWPQYKVAKSGNPRVKCPTQGYNNAWPVRESNQRSATFRSLIQRTTTKLTPSQVL